MNDVELLEAYVKAYEEGFVERLSDCKCTQECDDCPASGACSQLSEGDYKIFVTNYNMLMEGLYNA